MIMPALPISRLKLCAFLRNFAKSIDQTLPLVVDRRGAFSCLNTRTTHLPTYHNENRERKVFLMCETGPATFTSLARLRDGVPAEFSEGRRRDVAEGSGRAVAGPPRGERREAHAVDPAGDAGERVLLSRAPLC